MKTLINQKNKTGTALILTNGISPVNDNRFSCSSNILGEFYPKAKPASSLFNYG
jgi:hypothetical protein